MNRPIRVLMADVPRLPRELLGREIERRPELELLPPAGASLEPAVDEQRPDVVVVGHREAVDADTLGPLLRRRPELRVLSLTSDGRRAFLYELRPHRRWLGELSGVELVDILTQSRSGGTTGEAARD